MEKKVIEPRPRRSGKLCGLSRARRVDYAGGGKVLEPANVHGINSDIGLVCRVNGGRQLGRALGGQGKARRKQDHGLPSRRFAERCADVSDGQQNTARGKIRPHLDRRRSTQGGDLGRLPGLIGGKGAEFHLLDSGLECHRVRRKVLRHAGSPAEIEDGHQAVLGSGLGHKFRRRFARLHLVPAVHRGIVEKQNDVSRRLRCVQVRRRHPGETRDGLFLVVFEHAKIFCFEVRDVALFLVGGDNVHQNQLRFRLDNIRRIRGVFIRGLLTGGQGAGPDGGADEKHSQKQNRSQKSA